MKAIKKLIERMEISGQSFTERAEEALQKRTKVQGGQLLIGRDLNKTLTTAEDEAKRMGDEYVSVEHLFLSMLKNPNPEVKAIFSEYGITQDRFLKVFRSRRRLMGGR